MNEEAGGSPSGWVSGVWIRANFTDRMFLVFFGGLSLGILFQHHRVPGWPAYLELNLAVAALVLLLATTSLRFPTAHGWYPVVMPLVTFLEVAHLNFLFLDHWQDRYLLAFEAWLFPVPPTLWLSRFYSPLVTEILQMGYFSYYFFLILVAGVLYRRARKGPFYGVMAATVLAYLVCYVVFLTFPTEGPAHTLGYLHPSPPSGGPFHWLVNQAQRAGVHGNAFPSAHVAGTVAPLVFAWRYARGFARWLTPFAVLLCIAAVYDRYHYASDIIGGIAVGMAGAGFILFAQARPRLARVLNLEPVPSPGSPAPAGGEGRQRKVDHDQG